jgi:hypothetical protein
MIVNRYRETIPLQAEGEAISMLTLVRLWGLPRRTDCIGALSQ